MNLLQQLEQSETKADREIVVQVRYTVSSFPRTEQTAMTKKKDTQFGGNHILESWECVSMAVVLWDRIVKRFKQTCMDVNYKRATVLGRMLNLRP